MARPRSRARARTASGACCTRATSPGREIARTLWHRGGSAAGVRVLHDALATTIDLVGGECRGVRFVCGDGRTGVAHARAVLLATGGAGRVFRETTNPAVATGDGLAMAYRCGARVSDLEFVQFHPTVLSAPGAARFLLSEALRGEGARLVNADGEAFMTRYDPAGDLASRDVVATAMVREQMRTGRAVYLSLAHLDAGRVRARFPTIAQVCAAAGLDLAKDALPVSPAAHYMCGGVDTDLEGRTSIPGLFAAGEVACTGVHGANRLASNSLLEGLVFGARAADAMAAPAAPVRLRPLTLAPAEAQDTAAEASAAHADDMRSRTSPMMSTWMCPAAMWEGAGLVRDADGASTHPGPGGCREPAARARVGRRIDPDGMGRRLGRARGMARHARGAPPRGEPRRAPACGLSRARRFTLAAARRRPARAVEGRH